MPTNYEKRCNTVVANSGFTNTANAIDGAVDSVLLTWCSWTSVVANATATITLDVGTQYSSMPSTYYCNWAGCSAYVAQTGSINGIGDITMQVFDGTTALSTKYVIGNVSARWVNVPTFNPTWAQLRSANMKVVFTATKLNNTYSCGFQIDCCEVSCNVNTSVPGGAISLDKTTAKVGDTVTASYVSQAEQSTSRSWNFGANATPASATTGGPHAIVYSMTGTKTISATYTNQLGSSVLTPQTVDITPADVNIPPIYISSTNNSGTTPP